ncbi:F-box/FBD/LRR-repeat protein [Salix suchowensis]|nr:F-box/FBD/LRR-repeat protein [Salix suchowensis]
MVRPVIESSLWSKRENQIVVLMMKKCSADTILIAGHFRGLVWWGVNKSSCNDSLYSSCFITTNDYISRLPNDVLLKHLVLAYNLVENVEISYKDLVSFKYHGRKTNISLKDVPRLAEVSFGGIYFDHILKAMLSDFSSYLSQLEKAFIEPGKFSGLNNLKQMELTLYAFDDEGLLYCHSLLEACPSLHRLSVQLQPRPQEMFGEMTWRFIGRYCFSNKFLPKMHLLEHKNN